MTTTWHLKHKLKLTLQCLPASLRRYRFKKLLLDRLAIESAASLIEISISEGHPYLVGRLGSVESRLVGEYLFKGSSYSRLTLNQAHCNAGIFPLGQESLDEVANRLYSSLQLVDLLGIWDSPYQYKMVSRLSVHPKICDLAALEPWWSLEPWSRVLGGKRVLVIHPFVESIERQHSRFNHLHPGSPSLLTQFDLICVRPPQTLGHDREGFRSWNDALSQLIERVSMVSFDVALIGCGAYGLPLGAAIKQMGKPAVHLGGALQLLFGIRGRRWEAMPQYLPLMNDAWVRPSSAETPSLAATVDGGCYW
jgi:hypothetical protein